MRLVHLLRKPLSETSVAANAMTHGAGAIHIDVARVPTSTPRAVYEQADKPGGGSVYLGRLDGFLAGGSRVISETTEGRWPANVILEHLPGCRRVGTRRVRGSFTEGGGRRPGGFGDVGAPKGDPVPVGRGYAGPDGMETVDEWECEAGCPVRSLDGVSGVLHARGNVASTTSGGGTGHSWRNAPTVSEHGPSDDGGASRFFIQIGGQREKDDETREAGTPSDAVKE